MAFYLITFHETDGNDATVYDAIVEAPSESGALSIVAYSLESAFVENGTPFSDDGSELGYYFDCGKDCPEDCDGHGGIALRTVETYATAAEAEQNRSRYHSTYTVATQ